MKWDWKKLSLSTLTMASVVTLAACNAPSSTTGSSSDAGAPADSKKIVIAVDDDRYQEYLNTIKVNFEKETGITVEVKDAESMTDELDKLAIDGPTGVAPDVLIAPYDRVGSLGDQGHIAPVTLGNEADYDETVKNLVTSNGTVYGAPAVIETLVLYYNKDLISEAPKTFADLEALAADSKYAFESESGKNVAFLANWTNFYYAYGLVAGYGGYVFGQNGTDPKDIGLANEGAVQGLEYAQKWYGSWPQGMLDATKSGDFISEQFISGKTAAIIEGPWQAATFKESGVNYGVAEIPLLPNGKAYEAFGGGKAWVISGYSSNVESAQQFLDYVTNEENQKTFYDTTQEVPANVKAREYATNANSELTSAVIAQFENAQPMPNISEMGEVWDPGATMFFEAASGSKDAATAAGDAVKAIQDAITQKFGQ